MNVYDRDEIARQFLDEALGKLSPAELLLAAQSHTAETVAKEIADLAYAIADAMLANSEQSK